MGMCAIYTAITPPSPEQLKDLARRNETEQYVNHRRKTLGFKAMLQLVAQVAPPERHELAKKIYDRDLWGFLTPAASRGNHSAMLAKAHEDIVVPFPLWPESTMLACLTGTQPATYLGNNLVMLQPELVSIAVPAFELYEDENEVAAILNEFLRAAADNEDAVLLHWDHR
ncbi:MAG: hypothetical protein H0V17_10695 [Deltaproteobacteria bacterium]|nr:hypothetical protein [Deltaproteobacteria bacterium]